MARRTLHHQDLHYQYIKWTGGLGSHSSIARAMRNGASAYNFLNEMFDIEIVTSDHIISLCSWNSYMYC